MKFICTRCETGKQNLNKGSLFPPVSKARTNKLVRQCTYIYYITSILLKGMTPPEFIKHYKRSFRLELNNTFSINQSFNFAELFKIFFK